MPLPGLAKKKEAEQHRVEQDAHTIAKEGPPHYCKSLGSRRESHHSRAARQDVDEDRQVVPQSTCTLAGQSATVKEN